MCPLKCAPLRRPGHGRRHACRSRNDTHRSEDLEFPKFLVAGKNQKGAPLNCETRLFAILEHVRRYIFDISTEALVISQSMRNVQLLAVLSKAIVKFSTAEGSVDAFMSIRATSSDGPGDLVPPSTVVLLTNR